MEIDELRKKMLGEVQKRTSESLAARDRLLAHGVNALDELTKIINLVQTRRSEWFIEELKNPKDMEIEKRYSEEIDCLVKLQEALDSYIDSLAMELMPNACRLAPPKVAAKLLAHAGSLERLAKMPASTIQVIGAERALFKHLRKKTKPPKHGIIFQSPLINHAPKEERGRIARALAAKLALAFKLDAFGKRDFGDKLKTDLDRRLSSIHPTSESG